VRFESPTIRELIGLANTIALVRIFQDRYSWTRLSKKRTWVRSNSVPSDDHKHQLGQRYAAAWMLYNSEY